MKHPPYHLRINKAVDRFILIDILNILRGRFDLSEYSYHGFGGPFLEDFRLIHGFYPDMKMVSIERDAQTFLRQEFHRFTRNNLTLIRKDLEDYLTQDFESEHKDIFWLDYVDSKYRRLEEFKMLLKKVGLYSVIKISVRAQIYGNPFRERDVDRRDDLTEQQSRFLREFNREYRDALTSNMDDKEFFARPFKTIELIYNMIQTVAAKALPHEEGCFFQPLSAVHYQDGVPMLSVTGIVCPTENREELCNLFRDWRFANLTWQLPRKIDMPHLSIKERLLIEHLLPAEVRDGSDVLAKLGYYIDSDQQSSVEKILQYEDFYRHYPHFIRAVV